MDTVLHSSKHFGTLRWLASYCCLHYCRKTPQQNIDFSEWTANPLYRDSDSVVTANRKEVPRGIAETDGRTIATSDTNELVMNEVVDNKSSDL